MRVSICLRRGGLVYRLVWVNESTHGVYMGLLGGQSEFHVSYHRDGKRHDSLGGERMYRGQDVAISEWKGIRQLHSVAMSLDCRWFTSATRYSGDLKTETVVLLDQSSFADESGFGYESFLFDRESEGEYFDLMNRLHEAEPLRRPIAEVCKALDHFPDHKLSIVVRAQPNLEGMTPSGLHSNAETDGEEHERKSPSPVTKGEVQLGGSSVIQTSC